tara:strand:+ start:457 stop:657 length:201 start_codon:yes stop_codon:yes gene_type:complete
MSILRKSSSALAKTKIGLSMLAYHKLALAGLAGFPLSVATPTNRFHGALHTPILGPTTTSDVTVKL